MNYSNPAERLYYILEQINDIGSTVSFREAWGMIFDTEDITEILYVIGDVLNLIKQTEELIESLDIDSTDKYFYIAPIKKISNGFKSIDLEADILRLKSYLDETTMTSLHFSVLMIKQNNSSAPSIEDEELKSLQIEIESLSSRVVGSALPIELKSFLVEKLEVLRKSLIKIQIGGIEELRKAVEESLGAAVLNREVISQNGNDQNVKGFFGVLAKIHQIVALTKDSKELITPLMKLFLD